MKTKFIALLIVTVLFKIQCLAQKLNEIRAYFGSVDSELLNNEDIIGGASYENDNSHEFGLRYLRKYSEKLSFETGINFISTKVKITPEFMGRPVESRYETLKMLSVPIYANYALGKYFFLNGGPILDFQNSKKSFDTQSGIGYGLGIGGMVKFNSFSIFLNPNFKRHALIPFQIENNYQKLTEFGIQLGVGFEL
jgi:hypothetical protein